MSLVPFKNNGILTNLWGLLQGQNDKFEGKVTKTGRQVIKAQSNNIKLSATRYPNGTIVETRTTRPQDE